MLALVKCQWCGNKGEKTVMLKEHPKGYIHIECLPKYIEDKKFKQSEREKKDKLAAKISEIYGLASIQMIPSQIWPFLEDLRNDSKLFGKMGKNYKAGIPYEGIEYTYEFCKEKILYARDKIEFKNLMAELKYGIAIIRNNLSDAKNHAIQQKRVKELSVIEKDKNTYNDEEKIVVYKKKESKGDISDFL